MSSGATRGLLCVTRGDPSTAVPGSGFQVPGSMFRVPSSRSNEHEPSLGAFTVRGE